MDIFHFGHIFHHGRTGLKVVSCSIILGILPEFDIFLLCELNLLSKFPLCLSIQHSSCPTVPYSQPNDTDACNNPLPNGHRICVVFSRQCFSVPPCASTFGSSLLVSLELVFMTDTMDVFYTTHGFISPCSGLNSGATDEPDIIVINSQESGPMSERKVCP